MGRFLNPDWSDTPKAIPYADSGNPQSLNLYSYVLNNPLTSRDPDGHAIGDQGSNAQAFADTVVGIAGPGAPYKHMQQEDGGPHKLLLLVWGTSEY